MHPKTGKEEMNGEQTDIENLLNKYKCQIGIEGLQLDHARLKSRTVLLHDHLQFLGRRRFLSSQQHIVLVPTLHAPLRAYVPG